MLYGDDTNMNRNPQLHLILEPSLHMSTGGRSQPEWRFMGNMMRTELRHGNG
jgi:hypothetical protein